MRSVLTANDYTSTEVLAAEQSKIFRRLWIVAGFRALLDAPDAFITHVVGGVPIFIQNTRDGLRAFVNRCAHRQSPIHISDFGQRRSACPYHGWVYDDAGHVKSIPGNLAIYHFPTEVTQELRLHPVHIHVVGGLIFVNLDDEPLPIESQFTPEFLEQAATISAHVGSHALFAQFEGKYNWKLNFENVVDMNHVPFVHAGSFASLMPGLRGSASNSQGSNAAPPVESEVSSDIRELSYITRAPFDFQDWPWHSFIDRCGPTAEYLNLFIYPNVNYVVMAGAVHLIQQFVPTAPDRTTIRLTMALGSAKRKLRAAPAILWSHMRSEKRVIDEDVAVLEGIQRGYGDDSSGAFHGAYEYRLRRIASVYRRLLAAP